MRLSEMMKFESYEAVEDYIGGFEEGPAQVTNPSLNYFKSKYQFHILCFLHKKEYGIQRGLETI